MWYIAVILGLVQGLGEFLPISSSAHLIIVRWLFHWDQVVGNSGLALDVALHAGTALAVLVYFFADWLELTLSGFCRGISTPAGKMFWFLAAASLPGAAAGLALESMLETVIRRLPLLIAAGLAALGVILYYVDRKAPQRIDFSRITGSQALFIGICQALALVPGVSRSGITMTAGRLMGLSREAAAKFSFLLATPLIAGAALRHMDTIVANIANPLFIAGTLTAAIAGLLAIRFLLRYLQTNNFAVFAVYRLVAAAMIVGMYFVRGV